MASFLIARLPSHPMSLDVVEFMVKNDFSYRISTNIPLMNFLLSSGGGDSRQPGISEEFEQGKEEVHVIANMTCIFPSEIKVEVDTTENSRPIENPVSIERIIKEEDDVFAVDQQDDQNPRLEIAPEAVPPLGQIVIPMDVQENPPMDDGHTEDDVVDDHQDKPEEEANSFLNQVENNDVMNENVLLADDHKFDESNAEISMEIPLPIAEQGVLVVLAEPVLEEAQLEVEEHEEQNVIGEEEIEEDEQRETVGENREMVVDELLEPLDTDDSMALPPLHSSDDLFDSEEFSRLNDELQKKNGSGCSDTEDDEKMEEFEEEEEELVEEQEQEANKMEEEVEEQIDENIDDEDMDDEEGDSDEEEVDDDDDESSDEESDKKETAQKKKKENGRSTGNSIGRHLFACFAKNCSESFKTMKILEDHVKTHTGKQGFLCDVCKKQFSSKAAAIVHIQERKKSKCCVCGKKASHSGNLVQHYRSHTGEKPFVCKTCGKGFTRISSLKGHMLTHTGEKPFSCGYCKKSFALKQNLEVHERTHTGDKPYKCKHCDFKCGDSSSLSAHNRTHTGEKPYSCGHCEKRFSQKGHLKGHELTHTGQKPFECKDCGRRFTQKGHLNAHMRTHTGEKPYSCKKCDAKFTQSRSLKYHMEHKHK